MPVPAPKDHYTFADCLTWGESERIEIINGEAVMMAPPTRIHQEILMELSRQLANFLEGKKCKVYPAPFAVNLDADDKDWVEPDVSVVCDLSKMDDRGCNGAQDLVVEVVSPYSRRMDYSTKNAMYSEAGVREYWIIDPAKERTTVYRYEEDAAPMFYLFSDDIPAGIFPELTINVADLLK